MDNVNKYFNYLLAGLVFYMGSTVAFAAPTNPICEGELLNIKVDTGLFASDIGRKLRVPLINTVLDIDRGVSPYDESPYIYGLATEEQMSQEFTKEGEKIIDRAILFILSKLKSQGISLKSCDGIQVAYTFDKYLSYGWYGDGISDDCRTCGGSPHIPETISKYFGLYSEPQTEAERIGFHKNPRLPTQRLTRSSGTTVNIHINTLKRGILKFKIVLGLSDTYHPFIADLPANNDVTKRQMQVYGVAQSVRIGGEFRIQHDEDKLKDNFGTSDFYGFSWGGFHLKGPHSYQIEFHEIDNKKDLPEIFQAVISDFFHEYTRETDDPDFERKSIRDLSDFINLTDKHLRYIPKK